MCMCVCVCVCVCVWGGGGGGGGDIGYGYWGAPYIRDFTVYTPGRGALVSLFDKISDKSYKSLGIWI